MAQETASSGALDALLAGYAAGVLPRPFHVAVASHLEMSPRNRGYVAALEDLAASEALGVTAPTPVRNRDRRLAAILDDEDDMAVPQAAPADGLPAALSDYLRRSSRSDHLARLRWSPVMPGVREHGLPEEDGVRASLLWIAAGRRIPDHGHHGLEVTLVLRGAFSDQRGRYGAGDLAVADQDVEHDPVAEAGADCLCFAVSEGSVRLTHPVGRFLQRLLGR